MMAKKLLTLHDSRPKVQYLIYHSTSGIDGATESSSSHRRRHAILGYRFLLVNLTGLGGEPQARVRYSRQPSIRLTRQHYGALFN